MNYPFIYTLYNNFSRNMGAKIRKRLYLCKSFSGILKIYTYNIC